LDAYHSVIIKSQTLLQSEVRKRSGENE